MLFSPETPQAAKEGHCQVKDSEQLQSQTLRRSWGEMFFGLARGPCFGRPLNDKGSRLMVAFGRGWISDIAF